MKIRVVISGKSGTQMVELDEGSTPIHLLEKLGLYPDEVLVLSSQDSQYPLPINSTLSTGDSLLIVPVASGG